MSFTIKELQTYGFEHIDTAELEGIVEQLKADGLIKGKHKLRLKNVPDYIKNIPKQKKKK